jgi:hypothetical protein
VTVADDSERKNSRRTDDRHTYYNPKHSNPVNLVLHVLTNRESDYENSANKWYINSREENETNQAIPQHILFHQSYEYEA